MIPALARDEPGDRKDDQRHSKTATLRRAHLLLLRKRRVVPRDFARRGYPDIVAMRRDMREGAAQMMQAMGLPHDKMMQRYTGRGRSRFRHCDGRCARKRSCGRCESVGINPLRDLTAS